jgi:hypothetical protein
MLSDLKGYGGDAVVDVVCVVWFGNGIVGDSVGDDVRSGRGKRKRRKMMKGGSGNEWHGNWREKSIGWR